MPKCLQILKVCQAEDERQIYAFDLTDEFASLWSPNRPYTVGTVVRPRDNPGTGLEYVSSGGVSNGELEPEWPIVVGDAVDDGSLTWTAQLMTFSGLNHRIVSAAWTAPSDITADDQVETDHPAMQEARIEISGGTLGQRYTVIGLVTTDQGSIFELRLQDTIV